MSKGKQLHIAASQLTGTIFDGTLLQNGRVWGTGKQDVTIEALLAVAEHTLHFGEPVILSHQDGTPEFKITVEKLS